MRQEFPAKVKLAAFERSGGTCESCRIKIRPGIGPQYDHRIADAIGGHATLENCQVLCIACHAAKTRTDDVPKISKSKRIRGAVANVKTKRRGFLGWLRFNGDVVWRDK